MSSGILNLTRNIGGAFGIAIFGTLLTNATNAGVLSVAQHSIIRSSDPHIIAQGAQLIILKADLIAYGEVFVYAAAAMFLGSLLALFLLGSPQSEVELTAEQRAEAMAGG
ncbi:MAG: hypothetical protein KGJ31_03645, partial [Patescibacteria group bacterium]|nr:hypothetical protein [Patescibacteria group bacterium]